MSEQLELWLRRYDVSSFLTTGIVDASFGKEAGRIDSARIWQSFLVNCLACRRIDAVRNPAVLARPIKMSVMINGRAHLASLVDFPYNVRLADITAATATHRRAFLVRNRVNHSVMSDRAGAKIV